MPETSAGLWYTRCPLPTAFSIAAHRGILARHLVPFGISPGFLVTPRIGFIWHYLAGGFSLRQCVP